MEKLDVLKITLTAGAIKNGYLNIRGKESWFPQDVVSEDGSDPKNTIQIKLPDDSVVRTFVLKNHGRIKKRLGKLFASNALNEGQVVYLEKVSDYKYVLSFDGSSSALESINENQEIKQITERDSDMHPLNQILYGPPGTGKTYHAVNAALQILDPGFLDNNADNREALKKRFDQLCTEGYIYFVTFHQSFSYEDFVEGIKAETTDIGIRYYVESGIFKEACKAGLLYEGRDDFDMLFNQFIEQVAEKPLVIKTPKGKEFTVSYKSGNSSLTCIPHSSEANSGMYVSIDHIKQVIKGIKPENIHYESYVNGIVSHLKSLKRSSPEFYVGQIFNGYEITKVTEDIIHFRKPKGNDLPYPKVILDGLKELVEGGKITIEDIANKGWQNVNSSIEPYLVNGYSNLVPKLVEYLISSDQQKETQMRQNKPIVLIIDEINRGNTSSIFGELITLIEPSKRAGAEEALSVTLPYSKESFQVPSNLNIIGTMNTADRSLALMDTALRRRFDFIEMMPDVELLSGISIQGIDIKQMLAVMNKRIEVLYDREHTLGHAFFMPLILEENNDKQFALLQSIFSNKILPLLEEYFFEDWEKIRLVLGDNNKSPEHQFISENGNDYDVETLFGANADVGYDVEERKSYSRNNMALSQRKSYIGIYEL